MEILSLCSHLTAKFKNRSQRRYRNRKFLKGICQVTSITLKSFHSRCTILNILTMRDRCGFKNTTSWGKFRIQIFQLA